MKVLIIEDQEPMRRALCNCFLGQGVAQAMNLPEAVSALEGETFDLILADLFLPPENDPAMTLAHVRRHSGGAVVVAISGAQISPEIAAAADGTIQKTDMANCVHLRREIQRIVDSVAKRPPFEQHVKAVAAWAMVYGDKSAASPPTTPQVKLSLRLPTMMHPAL